MEEPKKISFGFSKQLKKPAIVKPPEEKKQFIDCLEGKSIKVKGGNIVEEKKLLVIPLKNKTTTAASLARIAQEVESGLQIEINTIEENQNELEATNPPENETLEAQAAREILDDLKKEKIAKVTQSSLVVPVSDPNQLTGEVESTLEDYENIPITDFGLAMLRGMGWQPGKGMGKHQKSVDLTLPTLRPKGMGLGADKVIASSKNTANGSKEQEEIKLIKGACVKITSGKQSGTYGQITGFDEDSGRLIVKTAIGGNNLNLSEFMVIGISKEEYHKHSKVINSSKYEEYKAKESNNHNRDQSRRTEHKRDISSEIKQERDKSSQEPHNNYDTDRRRRDHSGRSRSPERRSDRDSRFHQEDRSRNRSKDEDRYTKKYSRNSSSSSRSPERKRDKDKKRKGKKKKRDRSRSKEHRKR